MMYKCYYILNCSFNCLCIGLHGAEAIQFHMQAQDTTMDEDTLVTATEAGRELQQLRSKWRTIGTVLRLAAEVLDQIEKECSEENRLKQMLIQRQTRLGPLKWKDVIAALEDGTVGEERLALMLRMKIQFKVLITTPELEPPPPKRGPRLDEPCLAYSVNMFVNPKTAEKYRCVHCKLVPKRAHRPHCMHNESVIACELCVDKSCPNEGCNLTRYEYDSRTTKNIRNLIVNCPNKEAGCTQKMKLPSLPDHLKTCEQERVQCTYNELGCTVMIRRCYMNEHVSSAVSDHFAQAAEKIGVLSKELKEKKSSLVVPLYFTIGPISKGKKKWITKEGSAFYSHPEGYKLQLKMGVCVSTTKPSCFNTILCTLPGDNDDKLVWPMAGTLTIALLNMTRNEGHCVTRMDFKLEKGSQSEIIETEFEAANEHVTENEGELHFCIRKIELDQACRPWLLDPSAITGSV